MNTRVILVIAGCLAVVCTQSTTVSPYAEYQEPALKCYGDTLPANPIRQGNINACVDEMLARQANATSKSNNKHDKKKHKGKKDKKGQNNEPQFDACFYACMMKRRGMVTADSKYDVGKAKGQVLNGTMYPAKVRDPLASTLQKCSDKYSKKPLSTDNNCKTFEHIGKCTFEAMKKVCDASSKQ